MKIILRLFKHHALKTYGGVEVCLHAFLTSTLDRDKWSASRPGCFTPVLIWYEVGWAPEPVWTRWRGENVPVCAGNRTQVVEHVAHSLYWPSWRMKETLF